VDRGGTLDTGNDRHGRRKLAVPNESENTNKNIEKMTHFPLTAQINTITKTLCGGSFVETIFKLPLNFKSQ
jgi:hypothetical protein